MFKKKEKVMDAEVREMKENEAPASEETKEKKFSVKTVIWAIVGIVFTIASAVAGLFAIGKKNSVSDEVGFDTEVSPASTSDSETTESEE